MEIELYNLRRQYLLLKEELDAAIAEVIRKAQFIGGDEVANFEEAFASYIGTNFCVGCGNGTDAIEILLQALGVGKGDEVIVPVHSWVSTASAVTAVGAKPVFVDTLPYRYTIDPAGIEKAISAKTKAIMPVHLYGLPAEMDEIMAIAEKYQLYVVEDCAQAHGATYKGRKVGSIGHAASFSFYPIKNLGTFGDAGAMVTNDSILAEKVKMLGNYGQKEKHQHLLHGRNSRLDTLQAAILSTKLPYLDEWNRLRRKLGSLYATLLQDLPLRLPDNLGDRKSAVHLFVIQTGEREALANFLMENGISTAVHYPQMLPMLPLYQSSSQKDSFPVSFAYQDKILSLPLYPELQEKEVKYIAEKITSFFRRAG
ncbi:DegT/DnrJ/EryC1/StrS family aminotransferase [Nafulsella turpanensis]|uniref:DegT/DnrJ/EryC1/StrS family aminotransferase n=1 Tax=Nafulsella turpanensis TaxID=1265690 RepID=UPI0003492456|nr:DegT/DnrJ/EryC1/StrS family aminotransferase [Nafulsella turpanensis]